MITEILVSNGEIVQTATTGVSTEEDQTISCVLVESTEKVSEETIAKNISEIKIEATSMKIEEKKDTSQMKTLTQNDH